MSDKQDFEKEEYLLREIENHQMSPQNQSHGKPLPLPPKESIISESQESIISESQESIISENKESVIQASSGSKSIISSFAGSNVKVEIGNQGAGDSTAYQKGIHSAPPQIEIRINDLHALQLDHHHPQIGSDNSSNTQPHHQSNQHAGFKHLNHFRPIYSGMGLSSPDAYPQPQLMESPQTGSILSNSANMDQYTNSNHHNQKVSRPGPIAFVPYSQAPYPSHQPSHSSHQASQQVTSTPQQAIYAHQQAIYAPQQVTSIPQQVVSVPQQAIYAPQQVIYAPQQVLSAPPHQSQYDYYLLQKQASSNTIPQQQMYPIVPQTFHNARLQTPSNLDMSDAISIRSGGTSATSATIPHENLEAYRTEIKKSKDPVKQFEFSKQLVLVAEEMRKNPQGLDPQKIKKNRDILHHEALKWIKKSASAAYNGKTGYPDALFYMADCYGNGNLGLTIDHDRAFGYYTQGAKQDHPASIYRTGVCYEVGAGPKRDHQRAVQYYRKAAALGDPAAMFKVGMILLEGTLGQARNPKEGVNLLKRAATQADETTPYALHELAILYEGVNLDPATGIVPDPSYAFELYLKASKLGYAPSQYKLGLSHEYGHLGLAIDAKRSIAWYTKAAQQGEAEAELALSGWYLTGFEPIIQQSDKEAYLWARKAANKGLAKAEYAVGYFLEHGVGSGQNLEEARKWYIRSAGQGNSRAIARLSDRGQEKREAQQIKPIDWRRSKDAQNGNCIVM